MLIVIDGRDVPDLFTHEFSDRRVVQVGGVLKRVGASADRVACAIGTVGVDRDLVARQCAVSMIALISSKDTV